MTFDRPRLAQRALAPLLVVSLALSGCNLLKGRGDKDKVKVGGDRVPVLTVESGAEADAALSAIPVSLPAALDNADWGQPGGTAAKDIGHVALGANMSRVWTARIAGVRRDARLGAAPVVAGGTLFAMGSDAVVSAFDARSGALRWRRSFVEARAQAPYGGGVSVAGDIAYVTMGTGQVAAVRAADGTPVWQVKLPAPARGAPTVAFDHLYVMTQDNQLFALKVADGAIDWTMASAVQLAGVFGAGAPAAANGTIVAGFSTGDLAAYRYENGRQLWGDALTRTSLNTSVGAVTDIDASPVVVGGQVYAIGAGGRMVGMDLNSGQRLWELNIGGLATPAVAGQWLFVVTDDARLLCIDRASGKIRWAKALERYRKGKAAKGSVTYQGPVLAGQRLFLTSSEGQALAFDPDNGNQLAALKLGAGAGLPPVVAGGTLYILDDAGTIHAFR